MDRIEYDPKNTGRLLDRIFLDDESQKSLVDDLLQRVADINRILKEAYERGDIIKSHDLVSTTEGPELRLDIYAVDNGFWKESQQDKEQAQREDDWGAGKNVN